MSAVKRALRQGGYGKAKVGHEIISVKATTRGHSAVGEIWKRCFVKFPCLVAPPARPAGPANDIVFDILVERSDHALDIVPGFIIEMLVEFLIHLFAS